MLISIDTEFERRRTYRPVLSIVQVKEEGEDAVIYDVREEKNNDNNIDGTVDIKTSNGDLQHLKNILSEENNVKIIHSCRQDMEAIYSHFHFVMKNVFDTQIAAKYLGFGWFCLS